jgi:hypothetical protein
MGTTFTPVRLNAPPEATLLHLEYRLRQFCPHGCTLTARSWRAFYSILLKFPLGLPKRSAVISPGRKNRVAAALGLV